MISERETSLKLGIIGIGAAGSKLAACAYSYGYSTVVLNTALQDLKYITVPEKKKLHLNKVSALGGCGKDLELGQNAVIQQSDDIIKFLETELPEDCDMLFITSSLAGGTGSGGLVALIDIVRNLGKPIGIIAALPMTTDDAVGKKNSLVTLSKLAQLAAQDIISTLIIVDNSKIEAIYGGVPQSEFWNIANNAIIEPLHIFNSLTSQPSEFNSFDPTDFAKVLTNGDCSICGMIEVNDYLDEMALSEAVTKSLENGILAEGFNLQECKAGGVMIVGPKSVLEKLPANNINFMYYTVSQLTNNANIYRGVYAQDSKTESLKIYSFFSGLGLPVSRVEELKQDSLAQAQVTEEKEKRRATSMSIDLGVNKTTNTVQSIHDKIKQKNSAFGKLTSKGPIIDKRKR